MEVEKSYIEIKVTFIHIVVLLVGVILIGVFLFYLGYQSGKSSLRNQILQSELPKGADQSDEIQLVDEGKKLAKKAPDRKEPSISNEIKLHQLPSTSTETDSTPKDKDIIKPKPLKKETYFSIQVGAFSDYTNAKNYAARFANLGYPTEINTIARNNKNLHRVRVGNFSTQTEAVAEKQKLEKMEKKKFAIISPE